MMYEVDLRSRKTGNSEIKGILITDSHDKAWKFAREWNERNLPDYDKERAYESYRDGTKGLFADVYEIPEKTENTVYKEFDFKCRQLGLSEVFKTKSKSTYEWMLEKLRCRKAKGYGDEWNCIFEIRFR